MTELLTSDIFIMLEDLVTEIPIEDVRFVPEPSAAAFTVKSVVAIGVVHALTVTWPAISDAKIPSTVGGN